MGTWTFSNKIYFSLFTAGLVLSSACSRESNPLLTTPSGGVTSVSMIVPQIDLSSPPDNRVFIQVTDQASNPITNFALGNFSLVEDGVPGVPVEVGVVNEPLYVVLTIDRSGSMDTSAGAGTRNDAANEAATDFITSLSPTDYLAYLEFSGEDVVQHFDFLTGSANHTAISDYIDTRITCPTASGCGTPFYDAVGLSASVLNNAPGRRLMIVLTDGADTTSSSTEQISIREVLDRGISANIVVLGDDLDAASLAIAENISNSTAGSFAQSDEGVGLGALFTSIRDRFEDLVYVKYRRRSDGPVTVYLNYGSLTARAYRPR